jgi:hypothetical protein
MVYTGMLKGKDSCYAARPDESVMMAAAAVTQMIIWTASSDAALQPEACGEAAAARWGNAQAVPRGR